MERMEELASLVSEPLQQRFLTDLDQIVLCMKDNIELLSDGLLNALQEAVDEAACMQNAGKKGAIAYISFSLLQSNLLLEKYAFRIDVYDERFLIDDSEAASEWDFSLLLQNLDTNFDVIASTLRQSVIRVQEYELWELKKAYQLNYYATATGLLQSLVPLCLDRLSLDGIDTMPEVQFTVGPYMEKQLSFYQWRRET